jgi:hypothetical protein
VTQKGLTETCPICGYTTAGLLTCEECRIPACMQCVDLRKDLKRQLCIKCYEKAETEIID